MFVSTVKPHTTHDGRNGWLYTPAFKETPIFFDTKSKAVAVAKSDLQNDRVHHLHTYTLRGHVDYSGYSPQVRKIKMLQERVAILAIENDSLKRSKARLLELLEDYKVLCRDFEFQWLTTKELLTESKAKCRHLLKLLTGE